MVSPLRSAPVGAPSALQALHPIVCARTPAGCWHRVRAMRRLQLKREWVSVARVRLDSRKSMRPFKGIICDDISEFESFMPSHAIWSLGVMSGLQNCVPEGQAPAK